MPSSSRASLTELLARSVDGVISRAELAELGWHRNSVARQITAGRWMRLGTPAISLHTQPPTRPALHRRALLECGPLAALDGVSALEAAGMVG